MKKLFLTLLIIGTAICGSLFYSCQKAPLLAPQTQEQKVTLNDGRIMSQQDYAKMMNDKYGTDFSKAIPAANARKAVVYTDIPLSAISTSYVKDVYGVMDFVVTIRNVSNYSFYNDALVTVVHTTYTASGWLVSDNGYGGTFPIKGMKSNTSFIDWGAPTGNVNGTAAPQNTQYGGLGGVTTFTAVVQ